MWKILFIILLLTSALLTIGCVTSVSQKGSVNWECKRYAQERAHDIASQCASGTGPSFGSGAGYGLIYEIEYRKAYKDCVNNSGY